MGFVSRCLPQALGVWSCRASGGPYRGELDHVVTGGPAMLPRTVLAHSQGRVIAASPANHQAEGLIFDPHHDLFDHCADDPFARCRCRAGAVPGALDIAAKCEQRCGAWCQASSASPVLVSEGLRRLPGTTATTT